MALYPLNTNVARTAQSDVSSIYTDLKVIVHRLIGSPALADVDYFVTAVDMAVKTYTQVQTTPDVPRNVTVTVVKVGNIDTMGTIVVTGTDIADAVITETITPAEGTVAGLKAFKTVTSIVAPAGWVVDAGVDYDHLSVGFGEVLGLPDKLATNTVLFASLAAVREATAPTVVVSSTVLSNNTVDLNSACGGTAVEVWYVP